MYSILPNSKGFHKSWLMPVITGLNVFVSDVHIIFSLLRNHRTNAQRMVVPLHCRPPLTLSGRQLTI